MSERKIHAGRLAALALLAQWTVQAAGLAHSTGGHGYHEGSPRFFDPGAIVAVEGRLEEGFGHWSAAGHGNHIGGGMGFVLSSEGGDHFNVMLAPEWFLAESGIRLRDGERVRVTGSRVRPYERGGHHGDGPRHGGGPGHGDRGHDYLIAMVLEAHGVTLHLRDEEGYPLWRGGPGWEGRRWFDPEGITTLTGTLDELLGLWSAWGHGNHTGNCIHYSFESDGGESFYAMLGPWWFLRGQGIRLGDGRRVEIRGSVVETHWSGYGDRRFLVATRITLDGRTARLRDEWGYPLWHGTGWHYFSPEWSRNRIGSLNGEVVRVRRRRHGRFLDRGFEIVLRCEGETHTLFVAPYWDVRHVGLRLSPGDRVVVRGSFAGQGPAAPMVVQYVEHEGRRWIFRNRRGLPEWVRGAS